jgi:hypothetical protein
MTKQFTTSILAATATLMLALPVAAPADPVGGTIAAPVAKTKRGPARQIDRAVPRQVGPRLGARLVPMTAPTEACVYDDNYSMGATNTGTIFCTNKLGFQALPPERQGRVSAATIPSGYTMVLYERLDKTGKTCRYAGDNAGLDAPCDNMARAISLEADTPDTLAQAQNDQARRRAALAANDPGFAPNIERDRAAAAARQEEIAAEERNARARQIQDARREQDARAAEEAAKAPGREARRVESARHPSVTLRSTDGSLGQSIVKYGETHDMPYLGTTWNDEIEFVIISDPSIKVMGFEHENFRGRQIELTCGRWELIGDPENEISSIKIIFMPDGQDTYCPPGDQEVTRWTR